MAPRLLRCLVLALAVGCIKRINPDPGGQRTTLSGLAVRFGEAQQVPEGTRITWDFGDGTPTQEGPTVTHAFPRAGVYTVVETIVDKDGQSRSARTHVTALKRTVPLAVPADARAALMIPAPWARVAVHREVAARLSLGGFFDEAARAISEGAGFDVLDPKAADANGFDPDEGIALFTVPQDPEALVFAIGTSDDAKSLAAAKRLLASSRGVGHYGGGAFQLRDGQLADGTPILVGDNAAGDKVGVLQRGGYLYMRLAGATDPALALRAVSAANPEKGLTADASFNTAARHVGIGDALFFSRRADGAPASGRLSGEVGLSSFAIYARPENRDFVQVRMFSQLKNLSGDQLVAAFKPLMPPPDLASRLPSGAAAYLRISAAPEALWRELTRAAGADAQRVRDRVQETTGLDLEKDLIPSFAGNVGVGLYLDAAALVEAILGEQVGSLDRSVFLVAAQLKDQQTVQSALDRAMKSRPSSDRAIANGGAWYRLGDGAQAAIKDSVFFLALGGAGPAEEATPPKGKKRKPPPKKAPTLEDLGILGRVLFPPSQTLGQEFKKIGVQGFDVPGQENVWIDIAGIVRSIERAGGQQGGIAGQSTRLFAQRAEGLRDALFEARPGKEGIDADLWLRFLPQKKSAGR